MCGLGTVPCTFSEYSYQFMCVGKAWFRAHKQFTHWTSVLGTKTAKWNLILILFLPVFSFCDMSNCLQWKSNVFSESFYITSFLWSPKTKSVNTFKKHPRLKCSNHLWRLTHPMCNLYFIYCVTMSVISVDKDTQCLIFVILPLSVLVTVPPGFRRLFCD